MSQTFMIIPSLSCQASCKYCFGPHRGAVMDENTARETAVFVHRIAMDCAESRARVIFHGGEPLLAPVSVWKTLLESLDAAPAGLDMEYSLQSNLWALDDELLALFTKYRVNIGTSLDGPRELCDMNRGEGYFERSMAGVALAQKAGQKVSAIATLTKQTLPYAREILTFFRDKGFSAVLHGAIKSLDTDDSPYALTPEEYADCLMELFPWYVKNRKYLRVGTLDNFCRGAVLGDPGVCTLKDCSRMFLAISPTGDISSCQRMAGKPEFVMGSIFEHPALEQLYKSPAAQKLAQREQLVTERCGNCAYLPVCRGGCYYNALSSGDGIVDPLCEAYKRVYAFLEAQLADELGTEENLAAINSRPAKPEEHPLLRSGKYISLAGDVHPARIAENARQILAAHALGKYGDIDAAAKALCENRLCGDIRQTAEALLDMRESIGYRRRKYNNCYLHVTFDCNLRCTHCYASAGGGGAEMSPDNFEKLSQEAIALGFRQLVITGGEPLVHKKRDALLAVCRRLKGRGANLALRTNLTGEFDDDALLDIAGAFDQVVVSIDGHELLHDGRRGEGSYQNAVRNCERYAALVRGRPGAGELSLASVMSAEQINGEAGKSVRALGDRLEVRRVRFRPLLPLGRAAGLDGPVICEGLGQHELPMDKLREPFRPMNTCGIGQNIYICPDGKAYPCYAWHTEASYLGNVGEKGLGEVLSAPAFTRLAACTVDTIEKCRDCEYRYLCGGACRAWGNQQETDPNTAPPDCEHLRLRAQELVDAAKKYILD